MREGCLALIQESSSTRAGYRTQLRGPTAPDYEFAGRQRGARKRSGGAGVLMTAGMVGLLSQFSLHYLEYILHLHAVTRFKSYAIRMNLGVRI